MVTIGRKTTDYSRGDIVRSTSRLPGNRGGRDLSTGAEQISRGLNCPGRAGGPSGRDSRVKWDRPKAPKGNKATEESL